MKLGEVKSETGGWFRFEPRPFIPSPHPLHHHTSHSPQTSHSLSKTHPHSSLSSLSLSAPASNNGSSVGDADCSAPSLLQQWPLPRSPNRSGTDFSSSISSACAINGSELAGNSEPPPTIAPSLISSPGTATRSTPFLTSNATATPLPRINQLR